MTGPHLPTSAPAAEPEVPAVPRVAWCAVGGDRGGEVVPRWFPALAELGVERAHLFWAVPEGGGGEELDALRPVGTRWVAALRAGGIDADLAIKHGAAAPWLASLARLSPGALVVVGPPAAPDRASATLRHLLDAGVQLLVVPDLVRLPASFLTERPVVDAAPEEAAALADAYGWSPDAAHRVDLGEMDAASAARTAVRIAEDVDATLLVLSRRAAELVPGVAGAAAVPILAP